MVEKSMVRSAGSIGAEIAHPKDGIRRGRERGGVGSSESPRMQDAAATNIRPELGMAERIDRQLALRTAVLIDAIRCVIEPHRNRSLERDSSLRWIRSRDERAPFSFTNVCESLGFNPPRVRQVLLSWAVGNRAPELAIRRRSVARPGPRPSEGAIGIQVLGEGRES